MRTAKEQRRTETLRCESRRDDEWMTVRVGDEKNRLADLADAVEVIRHVLPVINAIRLNNANDLNIGERRELDYHASHLAAFLREPQGEVGT